MAASPSNATITPATMGDLTVVELCAGYLRFAFTNRSDGHGEVAAQSEWRKQEGYS
jgi:hypothetical protein